MTDHQRPCREFIFIRHGESESNADLVTDHPRTIRLTEKGTQQAQAKAAAWTEQPDIFITSKYLRTQQTALPFQQKFPGVAHEEWNIHEFTFLDPYKYSGTTFSQRHPFSSAYWQKADPHYKDADHAESFAEFVQRCHETLTCMRTSAYNKGLVFCHGYFMKGLIMALDGHFASPSSETMQRFQAFHKSMPLDNCDVVRFSVRGDDVRYTLQNNTPSLPETRPILID